jgi:hypothetical protein
MYAALIGLVGAGVLVVVALWKRFWNKKIVYDGNITRYFPFELAGHTIKPS